MGRSVLGSVLAGLVVIGAWGNAWAQDGGSGFIGSISGRVVDLGTGQPLARGPSNLTNVQVVRCGEAFCDEFIAALVPDDHGRFSLTTDMAGNPIEAGLFLLIAAAPEYTTRTVEIEIAPGQDVEVSILLPLVPVQILDLEPCAALPPEGGRCVYRARVRNNTGVTLVGTAASIVRYATASGEVISFEASTRLGDPDVRRAALRVPRLESRDVEFAFDVPAFPVDTHIHRLAWRWGLSAATNVERTERDLKAVFPIDTWNRRPLQIIYFGREYCPALRHDVVACPICSFAAVKSRIAQEAKKAKAPKGR